MNEYIPEEYESQFLERFRKAPYLVYVFPIRVLPADVRVAQTASQVEMFNSPAIWKFCVGIN